MGAILMFDILDKHTFHHASSWLQDIKDHAGEDVIIMLIANKLDALSSIIILLSLSLLSLLSLIF
jgi:GTPase SAR1 family protein